MEKLKFTTEALEYEQEKSERLLREAKSGSFEMSEAESGEFLDDMGKYRKELENIIREKRAELGTIKDKAKKKELKSEIDKLEEQLSGLLDFEEASKDAYGFTMKE